MSDRSDRHSIGPGTAILWATAILLGALVIIQAGRLEQRAYADQANSGQHGYSVCSATTGQGTPSEPIEAVYVVDSRDEVVLVYAIERFQDFKVQLRHSENLGALFARARGN
ncbi:MAG: hypothetical protein FJ270_01915 [Planctomycetes bacterium]|nr:hypothetical protein [Planctomycetota bacterium]